MLRKSLAKITGSLTARIFLITAFIIAASCGATYAFLAWATPISYISVVSNELDTQTQNLIASLEQSTLQDCGPILERFTAQTGASVTITDKNHRPLEFPDSAETAYARYTGDGEADVVYSEAGEDSDASARIQPYDVEIETAIISVVSSSAEIYPFSFLNDETVYFLQTDSTYTTTAVNQATQAMGRVLPLLVLVVLAISLFASLIYSWYITRPIVRISRISQKMAGLDFTWKCGDTRKDEIGHLGQNLDTLSNRLSTALAELKDANEALQCDIDRERELEQQRIAFFSAASHELKTPITILRGQLAGMLAGIDVYKDRDKYLAKSLAAANRMEGLVQEILTISRMERSDFILRQETVDLSAMLRKQAECLGDLMEQRNQTLITDIMSGQMTQGDAFLLEQVITNLLGNASLYAPEGAQIGVRLRSGPAGIILTVVNSQSYIPEDSLPHLFEAFYRVDASRSRATGGSGLGLYLVKIILDSHEAQYRIENQDGGVMTTVIFRIPPETSNTEPS